MDGIDAGQACRDRDSILWRRVATLAAVLALFGAGYLAFVSLVLGVPPAGCGAGSSCGEIISSSWAKLFGMPVSVLALGLYLFVIVLINTPAGPLVIKLRVAAAGAIGGAVAWFIILQAFVLHAFCPYCMADHAIGLVVAALLLAGSRRAQAGRWLLAGMGAAAFLALGQIAQPRPLANLKISIAGDADRETAAGRELAIQDGKLRLLIASEPRFGSATGHVAVVLMFDYACPHCRQVHHFCKALAERSRDLLVVSLATPLGAECNRLVTKTETRFRHSCELARLSLAVFFTAPERWEEFDQWMYEPEAPRTAEQTRARVVGILGNSLNKALADERVERMLRRNVAAFGAIPSSDPAERRLPVIWSPGRPPIVGPVESAGSFVDWLNRPAGIAAPDVAVKPSNPGG